MRSIFGFMTGVGVFGIATWAILGQPANEEPPAGIEVQARGPIHEAFAQPSAPTQGPSEPIAKKPPELIDELPPEQKPDVEAVLWIPGYWAWDEDRDDFLWVSGIWRVPVPDRRWIPGYWHEADKGWQWVTGYWTPVAETVELYPTPPEPIAEAIAPPANADSVYVPGNWVYHETRFRWRSGHWIGMRPGWVWMPARYCWTPAGYCFIDGCWDYELQDRGMCFAPIYVNRRLWRDGAVYRPHYHVRADFLFGSLFVHSGRHHYFFGDYYDAGYSRRGYVAWTDYRIRDAAYDPLFSYYRWHHRAQPRWEGNVRAVFVDRRDNQDARPPRTLALQEKAPKKKNQSVALASFEQGRTDGVKLVAVSKVQVAEYHKHAVEVRKISTTRVKLETSVKESALKSPTAAPIKLELPKSTIKVAVGKKTPPPTPDSPKVQDPPKDKVDPPKDRFDPPKDKVDPPKDKKNPPKDRFDPPKDKFDPPKDKVDPPKDKKDPPKDRFDPPKDKFDPPKDKVDPSKDKKNPPKDRFDPPKDKFDPPKEKKDPPKDKKVDPPKEKSPKVDPPKEKSPSAVRADLRRGFRFAPRACDHGAFLFDEEDSQGRSTKGQEKSAGIFAA